MKKKQLLNLWKVLFSFGKRIYWHALQNHPDTHDIAILGNNGEDPTWAFIPKNEMPYYDKAINKKNKSQVTKCSRSGKQKTDISGR